MREAMKAIEYANAIVGSIRWPSNTDVAKFKQTQAGSTDAYFEHYANRELRLLCSEALPASLAESLVKEVVAHIARDITGQNDPENDLVGNLAEVFVGGFLPVPGRLVASHANFVPCLHRSQAEG